MPKPIFWRCLTLGIRRLLNPDPWTPSDEEINEIKAFAKREGINFWEAVISVEPRSKGEAKE